MRVVLIIAILAEIALGQATGTWKMNPGKTIRQDNEPFPRSLAIRYEPHPDGEAVTIWRVTQEGRSETISFILRFDGKDYPNLQEEGADSICARKLEDGSIEVIHKKEGKVVVREIRRLSADGRQMTIQLKLLSKTGQWVRRVVIFEKQT
jgi:hypothetical protein